MGRGPALPLGRVDGQAQGLEGGRAAGGTAGRGGVGDKGIQAGAVAPRDGTRSIAQGQYLVHCWDGDALQAIDSLGGDDEAKALVDFVRPTEGFGGWIDNLAVPVGNASRYGIHLLMDYLMDPQVAGKNASWIWFLSAITSASWEYTDEFALSLTPTEEELARMVFGQDVGAFMRAYDEAWVQIKSA